MDINEILGRYTSRAVGGFAVTLWLVTQHPELSWQLIATYVAFLVGYFVHKKHGINGKQVVVAKPADPVVGADGRFLPHHIEGGG